MSKRDETLEMARMYQSGLRLRQIGTRYGVSRQTVQQRLAALGITARDRPAQPAPYQLIDKERLGALYRNKISLKKIGVEFGVCAETIRQAVMFHRLPKRDWIRTGGSKVDIMRRLAIGDKYEAVYTRRRPYASIYTPAKRVGIKVSIRSLGEGRLEITRIA